MEIQAPRPTYFALDAVFRSQVQAEFDHTPFLFHHNVQASGLFSWSRLLRLAESAQSKSHECYFESGNTNAGAGWSGPPKDMSLLYAFDHIADSESLIMLKRVHDDPDYHDFLEATIDEWSEITGADLRKRYRDGLITVLITSPGRVTPYHIDSEANLLLQIQGAKVIHIFNGDDGEVLSEKELEKFWSGEDIKAAQYRESQQEKAWHFNLEPGLGICNPVTFPHWVKNGGEVSVSVSINFKRVADPIADAYRVNNSLRRIGLHPHKPGALPILDNIKSKGYQAAKGVKRILHPHASGSSPAKATEAAK